MLLLRQIVSNHQAPLLLRRFFCRTSGLHDTRQEFSKSDRDPNWADKKECQNGRNKCMERADDCNEVKKNHPPPYQQAWCDDYELLPKPLYTPRECCIIEPPRRPRKEVKASDTKVSSCPRPPPEASCGKSVKDTCVKILMKGCKPANNPPTCIRKAVPLVCVALPTPMPSFHECIKDPVKPLPPDECHCFDKQPPCTPTPRMLADR